MKVRKWSALVLFCGVASTFLQAQPVTQGVVGPDTNNVASVPYTVVGRAANSRRWGQVVTRTNSAGNVTVQTNAASYTEVSANLCFQDATGVWSDSDGSLHPVADGASSGNSPLAVHFSGDVAADGGTVKLTDPDGKVFISKVLGISLYDPTVPTNVLIGALRSTQGTLVGQNHVLYANAFTGLNADLWYSYSPAGVSQDVVIHDFPAFPAGLNPQNSRIQIFTEWINAPEPRKIEAVAGAMAYDDYLDFGNLQMVPGAALFTQGQADPAPVEAGKIFKHWGPIPGSPNVWLVEEINYPAVANLLQTLPLHAAAGTVHGSIYERIASNPPLRPKTGREPGQPMLVAKASQAPTGLILDYNLVSSVTNFTFQNDTTYYVAANVTMSGTNTCFENGTVIKYAANVTLTVNSPVSWTGDNFSPVILTAKDDNGVGSPIAGSTGQPGTNYYAATALYYNGGTAGTNLVLRNLRVLNAQTAVSLNGNSDHGLNNVQMVNCGNGIAATSTSFSLWNGLMDNVMTIFSGTSSTADVEQVTVDTANWLNSNIGTNLFLTNCLLVAVTNMGSFTGNSVYSNSSGAGIFQTAGGGAHYLPAGSSNLGAGTTTIAPALAALLPQLTTYAPIVLTNNFTASTNLYPAVPRDAGVPAVGWHYQPLDYIWSNLTVNTGVTLTLNGGVGVGVMSATGLTVNGSLVSQGMPVNLNHLAAAAVVQEQPMTNLNVLIGTNGSWQSVFLRFTDLPVLGGSSIYSYGMYLQVLDWYGAGVNAGPVTIWDCQLTGGAIAVNFAFGFSSSLWMNLYNNVFDRAALLFSQDSGNAVSLNYNNNLLRGGALNLSYDIYTSGSSYWQIQNNLFDNSVVSESGMDPWGGTIWPTYVANDHNAYCDSTELLNASGDLLLSNVDYQAGPLGGFYYPATGTNLTRLIHKGDVVAASAGENIWPAVAGLYHYTVTTNNVIEGTNTVSIGFHYVAVDTNGNPLNNSGGLPDYVADANGDGVFDSGDLADWTTAASPFTIYDQWANYLV